MMSGDCSEYRLAQQDFHGMTTPILGPGFEEFFLPFTQQFQSFFIKFANVNTVVFDVIRSTSPESDPLRTTFELSMSARRGH